MIITTLLSFNCFKQFLKLLGEIFSFGIESIFSNLFQIEYEKGRIASK